MVMDWNNILEIAIGVYLGSMGWVLTVNYKSVLNWIDRNIV